jgi:hypothetical protein
MARSEESRAVKRMAEDIEDALEFNLPFIAASEGQAWQQVHELLCLVGRFADEAHAPELLWRDAEGVLQELHEALLAAVARGRARRREPPDPPRPAG